MPWTSTTIRRHKKGMTPAQASKAARIANAILKETGDDGKALRVAFSKISRRNRKTAPERRGR